jgi:hypothetical protein
MNYCLDFSNRVEDELLQLVSQYHDNTQSQFISRTEEDKLYQQALSLQLAADNGRTLADGNVRIGELILLVDCDTRVVCLALVYSLNSNLN